ALDDQPPRLARGGNAEELDEERRQVEWIPWRQALLGHLLWRTSFPDHAGEVLLGPSSRLLPVRALDHEARQGELRGHRLAVRRLPLPHEPVPLREQLVGN